jgi:hypothetical protein
VFGKKKLEKKLAAEGRSAHAVVLKSTTIVPAGTNLASGLSGGRYHVHVRVEPESEPPFEASFTMHPKATAGPPHEGQRLPVRYDSADPDSVIWDSAAALSERAAKRATDRARRERIRAERAAEGLPPIEADDRPDPDVQAKLLALQDRKDRGELSDWEFREARAEVFKEIGF